MALIEPRIGLYFMIVQLHIIISIYRGLLEVFKLLLEHCEYIGEQRIQLADSLVSQISEVCKTKRKDKEQTFKKVILFCGMHVQQFLTVTCIIKYAST